MCLLYFYTKLAYVFVGYRELHKYIYIPFPISPRHQVIRDTSRNPPIAASDLAEEEAQGGGGTEAMSPNAAKRDEEADQPEVAGAEGRLEELREGAVERGDCETPVQQIPPWLDKEKFYRAREIFKNHFFR